MNNLAGVLPSVNLQYIDRMSWHRRPGLPANDSSVTPYLSWAGQARHEVDFLLTERDKVSPIEVKSSGYKPHASLNAFCDKYSGRILNKYVVYTQALRCGGGIDYVPV